MYYTAELKALDDADAHFRMLQRIFVFCGNTVDAMHCLLHLSSIESVRTKLVERSINDL